MMVSNPNMKFECSATILFHVQGAMQSHARARKINNNKFSSFPKFTEYAVQISKHKKYEQNRIKYKYKIHNYYMGSRQDI